MPGSANVAQPPAAPRAAAIAGIVFAVLLTASLLLIRQSVPALPSEGINLTPNLQITRSTIIGYNLLPFAGIAFLWFLGALRDYWGVVEDRFFATVVLGSGLLFIALMFVIGGIAGSFLNLLTATYGQANADTLLFSRVVNNILVYVYATKMAGVFMFSSSTLSLRATVIPRWLAYTGFIFALVLLISIKYFEMIILLFPAWVLIFSAFILVMNFAHPATTQQHTEGT